MVLVSVARTHTISIRKFICQLDCDAFLNDQEIRKKDNMASTNSVNDNLYRKCSKPLIREMHILGSST